MPWQAEDSKRFTHKVKGNKEKSAWARIANRVLEQSGSEGKAIRIANAIVKRMKNRG